MKITIEVSPQELKELSERLQMKCLAVTCETNSVNIYDRLAARVLMASVGEKCTKA